MCVLRVGGGGGGGVPEQAEVEPACPWTEQYLVQEFM